MQRTRKWYKKRIRRALAALVVVFSISVSYSLFAARPEYVPGEILVKFKAETNKLAARAANDLCRQLPAGKIRKLTINNVYQLRLASGLSVEQAVRRACQNPEVEYAEPNYKVHINQIPDDPMFAQLYGLHNPGGEKATADCDIDAPEAWDIITDAADDVIIAVIDTGIDYNHEDLAANMWHNPGEIPNNGIDDDQNGYVDDLHGYDFCNKDSDPFDDNSHGSHCAGTIAGAANNNIGVSGVCWRAKVMAVKFLSGGGGGSTADAVSAIDYAVKNGAKVLSNSWGGGGYSQALKDAITASAKAGTIFVAAAGNNGSNNDTSPHYPSSYDVDNIIAVAATDSNDKLANFSCYGENSVDLAAPGVDILSSIPKNKYDKYSGTSMATPHVAGICALAMTRYPDFTPAQIKARLLGTVDKKAEFQNKLVSGGRVNLYKALTSAGDNIAPAAVIDLAVNKVTYKAVTLTWTAVGDDELAGTAASYDFRYAASPIDENNFAAAIPLTGVPAPGASGSPETFTIAGLEDNTAYFFAVKAVDSWGNQSKISNVVSAKTGQLVIVYADNIENGLNGWTVSGADGNKGPALWHQCNKRYSSENTSWYYGIEGKDNYDTGKRNYGAIISPVIDLTQLASADIRFHFWRQVEYYATKPYDILQLQVSYDEGSSWKTIWEINSLTESKKDWVQSECISLTAGNKVKIRFFFDTVDDFANNFEGIYLDDIEIVTSTSNSDPLPDPDPEPDPDPDPEPEPEPEPEPNPDPVPDPVPSPDPEPNPEPAPPAEITGIKWYLPEGCTAGFDEYVLIMNPNREATRVRVTFMNAEGNTEEEEIELGATSRYTIHVNEFMPDSAVSTLVESLDEIPIIAERSMYWDSGDLVWAGGHNASGITELSRTWYLAEGCTAGFDEWVLVMNPNEEAASVTVTFMQSDGSTAEKYLTVEATSRYTIHVNKEVPDSSVSCKVEANLPVAVERSMYWNSGGYQWVEGHVATAVAEPSREWYLAEGCTNGFSEWVLLMNPNSEETKVTVIFMEPNGATTEEVMALPATSRYTINVNKCIADSSVAAHVRSELPIIVERAMYWDSGDMVWAGGHTSQGSAETALSWYLAEGCTSAPFSTWVPIMNPNDTDARVRVTFMQPDGTITEEEITVEATSRYTVNVGAYVDNDSVSVKVESTNNVPVIAERAMYWDCGDYTWKGGHASIGVQE